MQNLIPGTPLQAERQDDRVPVLLIQRSVETSSQDSRQSSTSGRATSGSTSSSRSIHGWTLIIPAGWGMPFFSSLTHTGTRVGGQRERKTQAFEAGCAYFSRDFPFTPSYDAYMDERAKEEADAWTRKPPAKRTNWDAMQTRSPWKPDWGVVLGIEEPKPLMVEAMDVDADVGDEELLPAQREGALGSSTPAVVTRAPSTRKCKPWLLRGPEVPAIFAKISPMWCPAPVLLSEINKLRKKRKLEPLGADVRADDLLQGALVTVKIALCGRGSPEDLANIYAMDDEEVKRWLGAEARRQYAKVPLDETQEDETEVCTFWFSLHF